MDTHAAALLDALRNNQSTFVNELVRGSAEGDPGDGPVYSAEDLTQLANGFFAMLAEGVEGREPTTRTLFFETAAPGIRDAGTPLAMMVGGSLQLLTSLACWVACAVPEPSRPFAIGWLSKFLGEYMRDIVVVWTERPA